MFFGIRPSLLLLGLFFYFGGTFFESSKTEHSCKWMGRFSYIFLDHHICTKGEAVSGKPHVMLWKLIRPHLGTRACTFSPRKKHHREGRVDGLAIMGKQTMR